MKKRYLLSILSLGLLLVSCNSNTSSSSSPSSSSNISISSNISTSSSSTSSKSIAKYTITWNVDGVLKEEVYNEGEIPSYNYSLAKEADKTYTYTFTGWDKEIAPVKENITYTAIYSKQYIDYTITWVTYGGTTTESYHYGDIPEYKGDTSKPQDAQYTYTFTGWDKEISEVTGDSTYTATYKETLNKYKIIFEVDGKTEEVEYYYGELPTYDKVPQKSSTAEFHYVFKGWDKEFSKVTESTTYVAQFEKLKNQYKVTWIVGDNKFEEDYYYGELPSFKNEINKEDTPKYHYTFKGWDKNIENVTEDVTYTAQYDETIRKYNVNFYNETGDTLLFSKEFEYDVIPEFSEDIPLKSQTDAYTYTFKGWTDNINIYDSTLPKVVGETNYYATFSSTARQYPVEIECLDLNGNSLKETTYIQKGFNESYKIEAPEIEGKAANVDYIYGKTTSNENKVTFIYSDLDIYDGTSVSSSLSGEGTEENPYLIQSGNDLAYLRKEINDSGNYFSGCYFKLTKSIDLSNVSNFVIGKSGTTSLMGYLDGNNCSIRNLNISGTTAGLGLFCALSAGGTISNLSVYGTVVGKTYTGGIAGRNLGTIINCHNFANVSHSGGNGAGGIAGGNTGSIINCYNYGEIKTTDKKEKIGGITGLGETNSKIENCINYGSVTGYINAGGIVGENQSKAIHVQNCINFGTISGTQRIGGIVANTASLIEKCINNGDVETTSTTDAYSGGIAGVISGTATLKTCINNGKISSTGRYVGGIAGANATKATPTIDGCTNNEIVISTSNGVGGILGGTLTGNVTIINNTNNAEISGNDKVGGIIGLLSNGTYSDNTNNGLVKSSSKESYDEIGSDTRA